MGTIKENPNNRQIKDAKTTLLKSEEKAKVKLNKEIQKNKPRNTGGDKEQGAADEIPFDAKSNNMHQKK